MAGYNDTYQKIVDALMGRPVGTEIQPEKHQEYALNMLEYIRSLELISNGGFAGLATADTMPVESNISSSYYIALVQAGQTVTFTNFIDEDGNPLSINSTNGAFVVLIWNTKYWNLFSLNLIGGGGSSGITIETDYGLTGTSVQINEVKPNTLYLYSVPITDFVLIGKSAEWEESSICHFKFTTGIFSSWSISTDFEELNSITMENNKIVEVSILGSAIISAIQN